MSPVAAVVFTALAQRDLGTEIILWAPRLFALLGAVIALGAFLWRTGRPSEKASDVLFVAAGVGAAMGLVALLLVPVDFWIEPSLRRAVSVSVAMGVDAGHTTVLLERRGGRVIGGCWATASAATQAVRRIQSGALPGVGEGDLSGGIGPCLTGRQMRLILAADKSRLFTAQQMPLDHPSGV
jgi:hypothetical protein